MRQRLTRVWPVLVLVLFSLPLFIGLGTSDLQGDEAIYSYEVARALETGDWLTVHNSPNDDYPFLEKPPLKIWIVGAPLRLGLLPYDEFGLRFWDALFGGAAFLYVFGIGRRLAGPLCGFAAVLILFAHRPLVFDHGLRSNNMEAALVLCYSAGVYHFFAWSAAETRRRRAAHAAAVGLAFVLGFMTKFVAAVFLPMVLAAATLIVPEYRTRVAVDRRLWLKVGLLAAALIAPWFVYEWYTFGPVLWETILSTHIYTRFTSYLDPAHVRPWWFYFVEVRDTLKNSGALVPAIAGALLLLAAAVRGNWPEATVVLLWFVLPVAIVSAGTSKLYHYLYPFLPAVALAGGYFAAWLFHGLEALFERASGAVTGVRSTIGRRTLLAIAGAALAVGFVAIVIVPVRVDLGWGVIVRSRGFLRPFSIAVVLALLAGRSMWALRAAAVLAVVGMMPLPAYRESLSRLTVGRHPIRSARDCLQRIKAPGVYEDAGANLTHEHNYYLRQVGNWQRGSETSDAQLREYLFDPTRQRPLLLSETRYLDFKRVMPRGAEPLPMIGFPDLVLLLPGRYSACSPEASLRVPGR